jgi:hypothetical protein
MHLLRTVGWSFMLSFCCVAATLAEDPIVVHYSDPSLTRLEKQLGITAAQRDRFDDIVVKYRDPLNNIAAANAHEAIHSHRAIRAENTHAVNKHAVEGVVLEASVAPGEICHARNWMSWQQF